MFSLKLFNGNYEKKGSKNMVPIRNQAICASSTKLRILAVYPAPCRSSEYIYIYIYFKWSKTRWASKSTSILNLLNAIILDIFKSGTGYYVVNKVANLFIIYFSSLCMLVCGQIFLFQELVHAPCQGRPSLNLKFLEISHLLANFHQRLEI